MKTSFNKDKIKVLLLEGVNQSAVESFEQNGYTNIEYIDTALPENELKQKIKNVHFLGIRSRTQVTAKVLSQAKKLNAIGCFCIGTNQVDLEEAKSRGIAVFNAPYSNTRSVAELVIGEAIMLFRGVMEKSLLAHQGKWQKSAKNSNEIRGKKIGIIGYGHIGSQVGVLAESMGMDVYFYDVEEKMPFGNVTALGTLKELLSKCDVITLHVPATDQTKNMIGDKEIAQMKKGSYLINASRGNVIDINALANHLESKHILGAAVDVFPSEPKSNDDEFQSPLREFSNVILTPHIGGSTQEAQVNIGKEVSDKLIKYSDNGSTLLSVNFPEVSLPQHTDKHRVLHIHKNIPGILNKLNQIFAQNNINISSQYLQTNDKIGYVVTDVDTQTDKSILSEIEKIEGTVRTRILY